MEKREDYISWDEYFMGVAMLAGQRSKDPNTQVGACIVSDDNKILSIGYNGMPLGCDDDDFSWNRNREEDNKRLFQPAGVTSTAYEPSGRQLSLQL